MGLICTCVSLQTVLLWFLESQRWPSNNRVTAHYAQENKGDQQHPSARPVYHFEDLERSTASRLCKFRAELVISPSGQAAHVLPPVNTRPWCNVHVLPSRCRFCWHNAGRAFRGLCPILYKRLFIHLVCSSTLWRHSGCHAWSEERGQSPPVCT